MKKKYDKYFLELFQTNFTLLRAYTRVSSFINWIYKNSNMTDADIEIEQSSSKKLCADCKLFLFIYKLFYQLKKI